LFPGQEADTVARLVEQTEANRRHPTATIQKTPTPSRSLICPMTFRRG
jgi:hypothetical protein